MRFKELPIEERPRERLMLHGVDKLSNEELLMIILKSGTKQYSVKDLACNILEMSGGIDNLKDLTYQKLMNIEGIGRVKAIELEAVIELGRRIYVDKGIKEMIVCTNAQNIAYYFNSLFIDKLQEEFYCIYLDNKKKYLDKKKLFVGSINTSTVHPREIFKTAYLLSASFIVCIHNHPSGDPMPSSEDIMFTKRVYEIGNMHGIYLVDHIVIGHDTYYSFYDNHNILNTKR